MTDQTCEVIRQRRAQLTDEQLAEGYDYICYADPDCLVGVWITPDGEFHEPEVLEWFEVPPND